MQLIGTGKDPRFPDGQAFDVPAGQARYVAELIESGCAKAPEGVDPQRVVEIANAVVRGDALTLPEDRALASELEAVGGEKKAKGPSAHDIVQTGDPDADRGASELEPDEAAARAHQVEPLAEGAPPEHISDVDRPRAGEKATHTPTPRDPSKGTGSGS